MFELPGVVVPLLTPLIEDDVVDEMRLRSLVDFVTERGVHGLFALATTGEYLGLLEKTKIELVDIILDANSGRLPVWVGVGDVSTIRVLDNMNCFYRPGITAFVVTTPFFYAHLSQAELMSHFQDIADASKVPILLYNIPQNTHIPLEPRTVFELSQHPNIIGIKDSSGEITFVKELIALVGKESAFKVYEGDEHIAVECIHAGAYGLVSGLANLIPDKLVALRYACLNNDQVKTGELEKYINDLSNRVSQNYWLAGIKAAAEGLGLGSARLLKPWGTTLLHDDPTPGI
jgi:4-hydroxy-tetrahydrodipicolinate synthase